MFKKCYKCIVTTSCPLSFKIPWNKRHIYELLSVFKRGWYFIDVKTNMQRGFALQTLLWTLFIHLTLCSFLYSASSLVWAWVKHLLFSAPTAALALPEPSCALRQRTQLQHWPTRSGVNGGCWPEVPIAGLSSIVVWQGKKFQARIVFMMFIIPCSNICTLNFIPKTNSNPCARLISWFLVAWGYFLLFRDQWVIRMVLEILLP